MRLGPVGKNALTYPGGQIRQGDAVSGLGSLETLAGVALQEAVAKTGLGVVACDEEGRLTLLSPMLQDLFGLPYSAAEEDSLPRMFHLLHADGVTPLPVEEMPIARARCGEYVRDALVAARAGDGRLIYLQCNGAPLLDPDGRITGALVLAQDVTAAQEAERAKAEMRQRLTQIVDHEFRTPLAALLGNLEVVREHGEDVPGELARPLAAIERAGWRLRDLVCRVAALIEREEELRRSGRRVDGAPLGHSGPDQAARQE